MTNCPYCGGTREVFRENKEVNLAGRRVVVPQDYLRCTNCGEESVTPAQAEQLQRAAAAQIRQDECLLEPAEIVRIRKSYRLSSGDF